jgi:putative membrane protein
LRLQAAALSLPHHLQPGPAMRFVLRLLITAAALYLAVRLVAGIRYEGDWLGLVAVALVFGLVNAIVRPVLYFLSCPFIFLTLGLFIFVVNALMLLLTAAIAESLGLAFTIDDFLSAALGAIIVSITSAVLSVFVPDREKD